MCTAQLTPGLACTQWGRNGNCTKGWPGRLPQRRLTPLRSPGPTGRHRRPLRGRTPLTHSHTSFLTLHHCRPSLRARAAPWLLRNFFGRVASSLFGQKTFSPTALRVALHSLRRHCSTYQERGHQENASPSHPVSTITGGFYHGPQGQEQQEPPAAPRRGRSLDPLPGLRAVLPPLQHQQLVVDPLPAARSNPRCRIPHLAEAGPPGPQGREGHPHFRRPRRRNHPRR